MSIAMAHHDNAIYLMKKNGIYVLKWLLLVVFEERIIFMAFSWRGGAQYCNAVAVAVAVPAVARLPQARSGTTTTLTAMPFVAFRCIPSYLNTSRALLVYEVPAFR